MTERRTRIKHAKRGKKVKEGGDPKCHVLHTFQVGQELEEAITFGHQKVVRDLFKSDTTVELWRLKADYSEVTSQGGKEVGW